MALNTKQLYDWIHEHYSYDPETGHLTVIKKPYKSILNVGDRAGYLGDVGYRYIKIQSRTYKEHRLIWLYVHGYFPEHQIDHINRIKDDNRIENLREVSQSCNKRNSTDYRTALGSGIPGVQKQTYVYRVCIGVNGK